LVDNRTKPGCLLIYRDCGAKTSSLIHPSATANLCLDSTFERVSSGNKCGTQNIRPRTHRLLLTKTPAPFRRFKDDAEWNRHATRAVSSLTPYHVRGTGSSSAVQMLPAWPRLLPRLSDLPSAQPTIITYPIRAKSLGALQMGTCIRRCVTCARCVFVSDQSQDQRIRGDKTYRLAGSASTLCPLPDLFQFPPPSLHTHRPNPPSCPTLHPLFLRTISTSSFRRF